MKQRLCSGYRVFPNGDECKGCPDCDKTIKFVEPELTDSQKEYKARSEAQLVEWVKGNSVHNEVDNECCPDFSCCHPDLLADVELRKLFQASDREGRDRLCFTFLSSMIGKTMPTEKVFIADGISERLANNN